MAEYSAILYKELICQNHETKSPSFTGKRRLDLVLRDLVLVLLCTNGCEDFMESENLMGHFAILSKILQFHHYSPPLTPLKKNYYL